MNKANVKLKKKMLLTHCGGQAFVILPRLEAVTYLKYIVKTFSDYGIQIVCHNNSLKQLTSSIRNCA